MPPSDIQHWEQARAWLTLGNVQECFDSLERITPEQRANPLVLEVRLDLFTKARKWDHALPVAEALHDAFPDDPRLLHKLAIVTLNLGQKERARELMAKAFENGGKPVKLDALNDPNADGLWG